MDSAKRPLSAAYTIAGSGQHISLMLKLDDDLTQDQLTLQIMRVMDSMWKANGLDLRLTLYQVMPTGRNKGFIEIVPNAETITKTQKKYGGATSSKCVLEWLLRENGGTIPASVADNYCRSLAGYCVATYVLGIGDRHCSNMMLQTDGHFFHIDFGHFLGHFKKALGLPKENRWFYYSDALEEVLVNQKKLSAFKKFCVDALEVLRVNSHQLLYLLSSMLGTGIPELETPDDVRYVEEKLMLKRSMKDAGTEFKKLLKKAKASLPQLISGIVHVWVH
jgi:phosphatidylinositol-4,5-bisphosphate 3-kinase